MARVHLDAANFSADGTLGPQTWAAGVTLRGYDDDGTRARVVYDTQFHDHGIGVVGDVGWDQVGYSELRGGSERLEINFGDLVDNVTVTFGQFHAVEYEQYFESGAWKAYDARGSLVDQGRFSAADSDLGRNVKVADSFEAYPITLVAGTPIASLHLEATGYSHGTGDPVIYETERRWLTAKGVEYPNDYPWEQNSNFNVMALAFDRVAQPPDDHDDSDRDDSDRDGGGDQAAQVVMEFGTVMANHNDRTVKLDHRFDDPVVFLTMTSTNGGQMANARVTDVDAGAFSFYVQELDIYDGRHAKESFSYLVVEAGSWQLADGTRIEAGSVASKATAPNAWTKVDFATDFADRPVVLSQVQTDNDAAFVTTRQHRADADGVAIGVQEAEALNRAGHAVEDIGWLAVERHDGGDLLWAGSDSGDHQWRTTVFDTPAATTPTLLAAIASTQGTDPAVLRFDDLDRNSVQMSLQEDKTRDTEIRHADETIDFLLLNGDGQLSGVDIL